MDSALGWKEKKATFCGNWPSWKFFAQFGGNCHTNNKFSLWWFVVWRVKGKVSFGCWLKATSARSLKWISCGWLEVFSSCHNRLTSHIFVESTSWEFLFILMIGLSFTVARLGGWVGGWVAHFIKHLVVYSSNSTVPHEYYICAWPPSAADLGCSSLECCLLTPLEFQCLLFQTFEKIYWQICQSSVGWYPELSAHFL